MQVDPTGATGRTGTGSSDRRLAFTAHAKHATRALSTGGVFPSSRHTPAAKWIQPRQVQDQAVAGVRGQLYSGSTAFRWVPLDAHGFPCMPNPHHPDPEPLRLAPAAKLTELPLPALTELLTGPASVASFFDFFTDLYMMTAGWPLRTPRPSHAPNQFRLRLGMMARAGIRVCRGAHFRRSWRLTTHRQPDHGAGNPLCAGWSLPVLALRHTWLRAQPVPFRPQQGAVSASPPASGSDPDARAQIVPGH